MDEPAADELEALIAAIPDGWTRVRIAGAAWGITRTTCAGGRVVSFDAERLGGRAKLGANVWLTSDGRCCGRARSRPRMS